MAEIKDPENTILMELKGGTVTIELMPDLAPKHVERMKELARAGKYDNVAFHRVIEGFMAQTGDVANGNMEDNFNLRAAGTGGSDLPNLPAEFSKVPHARVAPSAPLVRPTPTAPTASSSLTSRTMISSTVSTPFTGKSSRAWNMLMRSHGASRLRTPTA